jgi:hypothetical protein
MCTTNEFNWATLAKRLEELDRHAKASILMRLTYEMTLRARDTYEPGTMGVSDPGRLRAINEVMHRVTRRLLNLHQGNEDDWSEAEFWQALRELSQQGGCLDALVEAATSATVRTHN